MLALTCAVVAAGCGEEGPEDSGNNGGLSNATTPTTGNAFTSNASTGNASNENASTGNNITPNGGNSSTNSGNTNPAMGVRESICGTEPHEFVQMSQGDWEVVAESGSLDGVDTPFTFLEGPVWSDADGALYFSDFNRNSALNDDNLGAPSIIWKYDPADGSVTNAFPAGSIRANGMARDREGNILVADHGSRGIGKIAPDGTYSMIVDNFEGNVFNAPNDLVATSDGSIFFTDPSYNSGVDGRDTPIGHEGVYRIAPDGTVSLVASGLRRPNGITTSIDETWLYVVFKDESKVYRYPLENGVVTGEGEVWIERAPTDGVTVDCAGNLYLAVPGKQLRVYDTTGTKIWDLTGRQPMTNVAFGGAEHNEIYLTEQTRLLRRKLVTPGMPY
jgi:gluconolactonase